VTDHPPERVLAAFGVDPRSLRPLRGGQGTAWCAGELILKPLDRPVDQLVWEEQVLTAIPQDGFRLSGPVRTRDDQLEIGGWSAWQRLAGEHRPRRWAEICAVGERFHRAIADIPEPGWLRHRDDVFARADRAAWDEAVLEEFRSFPAMDQLAARLRPIDGRSQLVHGDLTGNVLFHPTLPPGIIDVSPYWRPPLFATAVVVVDALVWEGADEAVLAVFGGHRDTAQYLLRAAIFRLVMDQLCNPGRRGPPSWWPRALEVTADLGSGYRGRAWHGVGTCPSRPGCQRGTIVP
jgi:uncharacterized protein (TIGR02569 family)